MQRHGREGTMRDLAVKYAGKEVVWLGVNSTHYMDQAHNKSWIAQAKLPYSILDDGTGAVGKAYGARTTPHMFVIDPNGKLAYQGAIDDDRSGSKSERIQYLDSAISDLLAGRSVQIAETKPYGCSVKYAS